MHGHSSLNLVDYTVLVMGREEGGGEGERERKREGERGKGGGRERKLFWCLRNCQVLIKFCVLLFHW